jgi:hypothetical protein
MYLEINMNTIDSPSHIPTAFGFGPGVVNCEQHAFPTAAAFLSYRLEIIDLIATSNIFHILTKKKSTAVGNLDMLEARLLFHYFQLEGQKDASHHPIGKGSHLYLYVVIFLWRDKLFWCIKVSVVNNGLFCRKRRFCHMVMQ